METEPRLTLFHYKFSPYAKRVVWYLTLRGINYDECLQPHIMPRPDLAALGVHYRRIPVLAIGRDVYCDSRLILEKLETRFPEGALGATDNDGKALEKLLDVWTTDGGVFARAAELIPPDTPLMSDPKFIKDREDFSGRSWMKEDILKKRGEALVHVKQAFHFLETTLLADGRRWIRNTEGPTLADIKAMWVLDWVKGLKVDDGNGDHITKVRYPQVFAWIERFRERIAAAKVGAVPKVSGADVLAGLKSVGYAEEEGNVDETDPLRLRKGQQIVVWPTDAGSNYRDTGTLVALGPNEMVVQRKTADERSEIRIHFPRTNFRVVATEGASGSRL